MLVEVTAKCTCDLCGDIFTVSVDSASSHRPGESVYECVENSIRGNMPYAVDESGNWLCKACTAVWLKEGEDDDEIY